jgi:hypothetical protein
VIVYLPIRTVVLSLASDLSQTLTLQFVTSIGRSPQTPGETRMYGTGRYSAVTSGATQQQNTVSAVALTPADVAQLQAWDGLTLLYRDDQDRFYGCYRSPQVTRHQYDPNADVSFTFAELSFVEAV